MTWNYRLVSRQVGDEVELAIHSAYYKNAADEHPESISATPATVVGETVDEIALELERMHLARTKPVLRYEDF